MMILFCGYTLLLKGIDSHSVGMLLSFQDFSCPKVLFEFPAGMLTDISDVFERGRIVYSWFIKIPRM